MLQTNVACVITRPWLCEGFSKKVLKLCTELPKPSSHRVIETLRRCVSWDDYLRRKRTIMENHIEEVETSSKHDKGFTLVELLIVIVILGILATVTVFAVRGITDQGQTSACAADKKTLEVAAEAYQAQTGDYPASQAAMVTEGLLRDVTTNYTYAYVAATAGPPATPENYTLTAVAPCA
jgi:prepilin-type N-terminal cleavage/methylation domain-containing protein